MINLITSRCSIHGLLLCFILLHISNSLVSTSLVGHVLYSADLTSTIYIPHYYLMVYRYIYSRYSPVFPMLYQLYHSLPSLTLISFSSLYLSVATWVTPQGHNILLLQWREWSGITTRKSKVSHWKLATKCYSIWRITRQQSKHYDPSTKDHLK